MILSTSRYAPTAGWLGLQYTYARISSACTDVRIDSHIVGPMHPALNIAADVFG